MASTKLRTVALTLLAVACAAAGLAAALVSSGVYNVAANRQHLKPVYQLLDIAMRQSVRYHARGLEPPRAADGVRTDTGTEGISDRRMGGQGFAGAVSVPASSLQRGPLAPGTSGPVAPAGGAIT